MKAFRVSQKFVLKVVTFLAATAAVAWLDFPVFNAPRDLADYSENTLFSSFSGRSPKTLDPQVSYSSDETVYTYHIYETLYTYHYLKRPYELVPRLAQSMPQIEYLDQRGRPLFQKDAPKAVKTRLTIPIKKGVFFAPHPAFAVDHEGKPLYFSLSPDVIDRIESPLDLPVKGTRELTAEDFVFGMKRLADPRIVSPVLSLMTQYIPGLAKLSAELTQALQKAPTASLDLRDYSLEGVKALDAHTLEIEIKGYYPPFINWLAMTFFAPVPWEALAFYDNPLLVQKSISLATWPVGTGPYQLTRSIQNREHVLSRNPNYRLNPYPCEASENENPALLASCGKPLPFIDRIVMTMEKAGTSVSAKFLEGYYDSPQATRLDVGQGYVVSAQDSEEKAKLYTERQLKFPKSVEASSWYVGFNWNDPVVGKGRTKEEARRNRLLRQAISIAIDWEEFIAIFEKGQGEAAQGVLPPGLIGFDPNGRTAFNPVVYAKSADGCLTRKAVTVAKALMVEAGYPQGRDAKTGKPLVLNFDWQGTAAGSKAFLDWMRRQFAKIDIQLEIRATDYNRFQDKMRQGAAQIFYWGWLADYPDAENFLFLLYGPNAKAATTGAGENAANYVNPRYDTLFETFQAAQSAIEKSRIIDEMTAIVQEDAPWSFGYFPTSIGAVHHWVGNVKPTQMIRHHLEYWTIDPKERMTYIRTYNRPLLWPLVLVLGGIGFFASAAYRRLKTNDRHFREVKS